MLTLIVSELLLISVFRFWPETVRVSNESISYISDQEVFVEEMIITRQNDAPARPPKPRVPVPVPTEETIEEDIEILDFENVLSLEPLGEFDAGQTGDSDTIVGNPQRRPGLLKIVEPINPEAARLAKVKAEVFVTFLVNKEGSVEDMYISKIHEYDSRGENFEIVNVIGYGIMPAALDAASQWIFRPALHNGKPVKAYTTQVFSFGF